LTITDNSNNVAGSTQSVTLTNTGTSKIAISNVSISGAGFRTSGTSAGTILTAGQTAVLDVTFDPAATGSVKGSITVTSNATNSPATITLSGAGVTQSQHSVTLSWNASTSAVIGYNVYRATVSGGPYAKLTSAPTPAMSYTDTAVQPGATYYYVATSVDSHDVESAYSRQTSVAVP
jgi:hypothetical protein